MAKKSSVFLLVITFLYTTVIPAYSMDESKIIETAEKVIENWRQYPGDLDFITCDIYTKKAYSKIWSMGRYILKDCEATFNIEKTNSIVTPYLLVIDFKAKWITNSSSPNANNPEYLSTDKFHGYKSRDDAISNTKPDDFNLTAYKKLGIVYAFQKNTWVFKKFIHYDYAKSIAERMDIINGDEFNHFLKIPIE